MQRLSGPEKMLFGAQMFLSMPALKNVRNSVRKIDNIMAKYNAVEAELKKPAAMGKIKNVKEWHYGKKQNWRNGISS